MKYLLVLLLAIFTISCSSTQKKTLQSFENSKVENDTITIANDSLEYEIIIIEPGFNAWLATQRPKGYYGQNYMEQRNQIFVTNYNIRANNPSQYTPNLYPQPINYEFDIDYGYEVNYLLYHYFLYFQEKYNQRLR
jgi:hypothetical protein